MKHKLLARLTTASIAILTPALLAAQDFENRNLIDTKKEVFDVLDNIGDWLFTFLIIGATIMLVIAAYNYLFSQGSEEKVATAKNTILYAVIALAVAMVAKGVPAIVQVLLTP